MEKESSSNEYWESFKSLFRPNEIVTDIKEIDFAALKAKGIKALILDIDDTLLPREVNDIYPAVFEWVVSRKEEGFRLCLTSNSRHPLRVKYIGDTLGIPAISFGFKPLPFAFWKSLEILGTKPEETAMVGDQLFMDILGANILKIYSIFIDHKKEEKFIARYWMRQAEQWLLKNNK
ncbi:MAG: YqeG family HAD IIIA-type phosphatase [Candidatus Margulisbacteria bacterium]|nr:YqeG family HAD IIIA-type phosphatase [Candidatus Margulisiibacteriota bacterium]